MGISARLARAESRGRRGCPYWETNLAPPAPLPAAPEAASGGPVSRWVGAPLRSLRDLCVLCVQLLLSLRPRKIEQFEESLPSANLRSLCDIRESFVL